MKSHFPIGAVLIATAWLAAAPALAQEVSKETVEGVTNFNRLETTVACAGATSAQAIPEIKKMGFASIINLRQASEYNIPFSSSAPDPVAADKFLEAITAKGSQPAFIHCARGGRAATMWFIKRLVVDHWEVERAAKEAAALGMTNPALKQFAIDYAQTHKR